MIICIDDQVKQPVIWINNITRCFSAAYNSLSGNAKSLSGVGTMLHRRRREPPEIPATDDEPMRMWRWMCGATKKSNIING